MLTKDACSHAIRSLLLSRLDYSNSLLINVSKMDIGRGGGQKLVLPPKNFLGGGGATAPTAPPPASGAYDFNFSFPHAPLQESRFMGVGEDSGLVFLIYYVHTVSFTQ